MTSEELTSPLPGESVHAQVAADAAPFDPARPAPEEGNQVEGKSRLESDPGSATGEDGAASFDDDRELEPFLPALEAVLFASPEPLALSALVKVFNEGDEVLGISTAGEEAPLHRRVQAALEELQTRTNGPHRGIKLVQVAGGWQFLTREECFTHVRRIARTRQEERLTPASVETLAVVAYKQPVTRADVDAIRGAASGPILRTLMDRGLVRVAGRAELPGSPFTYGTTREFLKHFGLRSTKDLPDPQELTRVLSEQGRAGG